MQQTYPSDLLLRYLCRETLPSESAALRAALESDYALRERLDELRASLSCLDCRLASPSLSSVQAILRYSRSTAPLEASR
jgi:hypothetical protein